MPKITHTDAGRRVAAFALAGIALVVFLVGVGDGLSARFAVERRPGDGRRSRRRGRP